MLGYNILKSLGIQGLNWKIVDIKTYQDSIHYYIRHKVENAICPYCGCLHDGKAHDRRNIILTDWSQGPVRVVWHVTYYRFDCECKKNEHHIHELLPFQGRHSRLTRRFETFIYYCIKKLQMTVSDVSRMTGVHWNTVYNIDKKGMVEDLQLEHIADIKYLGVDEVSFQKGHNYVTVISDVGRHGVVYVTTGNNKESLDEFFRLYGKERCKKIEVAISDMHTPYHASMDEYIPQATRVADPFHVAKILTEAIDKVRKELTDDKETVNRSKKKRKKPATRRSKKQKDADEKKRRLSRNRMWTLRKRKKNHKESQVECLEDLRQNNEPLYNAYLLKELFLEYYDGKTEKKGEGFLIDWIREAYKSRLEPMMDFADFINRRKELILNHEDVTCAMGFCEGINGKINIIKRMAYGYREIEVYKLKIRQRCGIQRLERLPGFFQWTDERVKAFRRAQIPVTNLI